MNAWTALVSFSFLVPIHMFYTHTAVAHSIVSDEFTTSNLEVQQSHSDMDIHKAVNEETRDIQSLIKNAKSLCKVVKGYKSKRPNHLPLTVSMRFLLE